MSLAAAGPGTGAPPADPFVGAVIVGFFILLRAALPRPRYDQLMAFGWKLLLPLTLLNILVTGALMLAGPAPS